MNKIIFWTGIFGSDSLNHTRPIGTYQLAHWLRSNNIECQVIDFCQWWSPEELIQLTLGAMCPSTKYIGVSTSFWSDNCIPKTIIESIKLIKEIRPDIKLIFGGQRSDNTLYKLYSDITIQGDAEDKLLMLLKGHNITNKFNITELKHRFSRKDCIIDGEVLPIELGRGCIFKCKFCGHHNLGKPKNTYQRCIHEVQSEMEFNYENFKTTKYLFLDDTVNEDREKVKQLSTLPKVTGINLEWNGYLRADLLWSNEETPYLLAESGMKSCFFGIETFNQKAALSIGKGWSGKHAKTYLPKLFNDIWKQKIPIWNNFIVGLPYETPSDLTETLNWCINNPMGHHAFVGLNLYNNRTDSGPRSYFSENYEQYGYTIDDSGNWSNDNFTSQSSNLLAEFLRRRINPFNYPTSWIMFDGYNKTLFKHGWTEYLNAYKQKLMDIGHD